MRNLTTTRENYPLIIKRLFLTLFAMGILGYIGYQLQNLVTGPDLIIENPKNGSSAIRLITLVGSAKRAEIVTVNGSQIALNESDEFSVPLLLLSGYNIMNVTATDRFGKQASQEITIIGPPKE